MMHDMISLPPPAEFMGKARRDVGLVEATSSAFTAMNLGRACGRLHLYPQVRRILQSEA